MTEDPPSMMRILQDLVPLSRLACSPDYERAARYLTDLLPFNVIEYRSADEYNGWVVPPSWSLTRAEIRKDGAVVYDGMRHPLAVIALSAPFRGEVDREELKQHLHYDHRYSDSLPFHFRQMYRAWRRDWGFCVPRELYDNLEPGRYEVIIETEESAGTLQILELVHRGRSEESIVFGANLDHPGVANDGLAGVVVGIELFRRLMRKQCRFSYRLVLSPGIVGSEYYLGKQLPQDRAHIMEGVFLEMLGTDTQLALQASRQGASNIERALAGALEESGASWRTGPFESIILNDEYLWEAYGIPMASLSRYPYPEYHSSRDDISVIREENLLQAVRVLERALETLEESPLITRRFQGNICLSNPRYDLYVDPGQVAFGDVPSEERRRMRHLMDLIPTLDRPVTARALAERVGLPEAVVLDYLRKWQAKDLLEIL